MRPARSAATRTRRRARGWRRRGSSRSSRTGTACRCSRALREHPRFPEVLERRRRNDPRAARPLAAVDGHRGQRSLWGDLPGLRTPLLFLAGERDAKFTDLAFDAVALCPRAEAVVLRGRGHALVEEDPEAVARRDGGVSRRAAR